MCMRQTYAPASAIAPASSGSPRRAVMSLTSIAPAASACRATSAFVVSIETGAPDSCSSTGNTRRSSSSTETASAPGRVGLAADVDERRTLGEEPPGRRRRDVRVEVVAAVREAVGRDVDDAHHRGARPTLCERRTSHKTMERRRLGGPRGMSPRRRALIGVAALLLLLIAVAVASTGSVPAGAGGARRPADRIVDVLITLYLLLMVVGLGMWVYIFLVRKDAVADALATRARRRPWVSTAHPRDRLLAARRVHSLALHRRGPPPAHRRPPPPGARRVAHLRRARCLGDATSPSSRGAPSCSSSHSCSSRSWRSTSRTARAAGCWIRCRRRFCPPSPTSSTRPSTTCGPSRIPAVR